MMQESLVPSDADVQTHKFLHDANLLLGSIDNLILDRADADAASSAAPEFGTIREMAQKLREKLDRLTK